MHINHKNKGILNELAKSLFFFCCSCSTRNKWKCLKIKTKLSKYVSNTSADVTKMQVFWGVKLCRWTCSSWRLKSPFKTSLDSHRLFVTPSAVPLRQPQIARHRVSLRRLSSRTGHYVTDPIAITVRILKLYHIISSQLCSHYWKLSFIVCALFKMPSTILALHPSI